MKNQFLKPKLLVLGLMSLSAFSQSSKMTQNQSAKYFEASNLLSNNQSLIAKPIFGYLNDYEDSEFQELIASVKSNNVDADTALIKYLKKELHGKQFNQGAEVLGDYYFQIGNYAEAVLWFQEIDPQGLDQKEIGLWQLKLSFSFIQLEKFQQAANLLSKLESNRHYQEETNYYKGYVAYAQEDYKVAQESLTSTDGIDTEYILMDIEFKAGAFSKVIETGASFYPRAKGKEKKMAAKMMGEAYFNLGNYNQAIEYLKRYSGSGIRPSNTHFYMLGFSYYKEQDYTSAMNQFNKIISANDEIGQNAYYHLGEVYLKLNKKSEALNAFKNAGSMEFVPAITQDALFNYAKLSYEIGNPYEPATQVMIKFVDRYPNGNEANSISKLILQAFINEKNYAQGLDYLENRGISSDPLAYQELLTLQGLKFYSNRNYENAQNYLDRAASLKTSKSVRNKAYFWAGESAYALEKYSDAEKRFKGFLNTNPNLNTYESGIIYYNLAYSQFKQENYQASINNFERFISSAQSTEINRKVDAQLRAADAYFILNDYWKAMQFYNKVIATKKEDVDYATYQKALCYGLVRKNNTKVEVLSSFNQKFPRSRYRDDALFQLGSTLANQGKNEQALKSFQKLVSTFPGSKHTTKTLLKEGLIHYNLGQNQKAINTYKSLVESYPESQESLQAVKNLEQIYIDLGQVNDYAKWVKKFDFISYSDDDLARGMYSAAEQKYQQGDFAEAGPLFDKYLASYPRGTESLNAHFFAAQSFDVSGNNAAAISNYQAVLNRESSQYTVKAAEKLAIIYLEAKAYKQALPVLMTLNEEATQPELLKFAQSNIMKVYTVEEDYKKAANYARKLLENQNLDPELKVDATYTLAKAAVANGQLKKASDYFEEIEENLNGENQSEGLYYRALQFNKQKDYSRSNDLIKSLIKESGDFPYWGAKGLLVMSQNFSALEDTFQATYILESVIQNYPQFKDVQQQANKQLKALKTNE
ncbi:MAG: tetratricopeptide repeat protein [Flavobacteriaceae bacterium]